MRLRTNRQDGSQLVCVPEGEFFMGSPSGKGVASERPGRSVYLEEYWITLHPITYRQFRLHCQRSKRPEPPEPSWGWGHDHPVVNLTYAEALRYCEWAGLLLPTEAQWERAARGTEAWEFPWGNEWNQELCNGVGGGPGRTTPVGDYPEGASPTGCLDMAGNVWEWCEDWYDASFYRKGSSWNPRGPGTGRQRTIRGGSWKDGQDKLRTTYRGFLKPSSRKDSVGFRGVALFPD